MCRELKVGIHTITICSAKEVLKLSQGNQSIDVTNLVELPGGGGISGDQKPAVLAHVETLKNAHHKIVNCKQGAHRSVVVGILYMNDVARTEPGGSIQELYEQAKMYVSKSALVKKSLNNLGYEVTD